MRGTIFNKQAFVNKKYDQRIEMNDKCICTADWRRMNAYFRHGQFYEPL